MPRGRGAMNDEETTGRDGWTTKEIQAKKKKREKESRQSDGPMNNGTCVLWTLFAIVLLNAREWVADIHVFRYSICMCALHSPTHTAKQAHQTTNKSNRNSVEIMSIFLYLIYLWNKWQSTRHRISHITHLHRNNGKISHAHMRWWWHWCGFQSCILLCTPSTKMHHSHLRSKEEIELI